VIDALIQKEAIAPVTRYDAIRQREPDRRREE